MQNHGGYLDEYENFSPEVNIEGYTREYPDVDNYLSLMKKTDDSLKYLIDYFATVEEPTMIVIFGDHQPTVDEAFITELYNKEPTEMTLEDIDKRYVTPYLIWTNYDSEIQPIGDISSNYLGSYILKAANVKMSNYNEFQLEMSEKLPILNANIVNNTSNENLELLNTYKYLEYNYIFDRKNRLDELYKIN